MRQEEIDKIKMVKLQIKRAISKQKWSISINKNRSSLDPHVSFVYLNSIDERGGMIDATIRITVKPKCKYDDHSIHTNSPNRKVAIAIKNGSYWEEFNALNYGFSKTDLRFLRWVLRYKSFKKDKLHKEHLKQKSIESLASAADHYIRENRSQFRDSKIEQILDNK